MAETSSAKSPDTILASRGSGETRYALLAGDDVIEVAFARDAERGPHSIIAGRVVGLLAGAMFVDIGDAAPGVLRAKAAIAQGQAVAVRLIVPARADKGAELRLAEGVALPDGVKTAALLSPAPDMALVWWGKYRDTIKHVRCEPASEQRRVRALLGPDAPVEGRGAGADLFEMAGVDEAIEAGCEPVIALPCGGAVIIETTAGATVIDIDAGPADPAVANVEAVDVIARALRLRNLGGHILIDVIPPARGRRTVLRTAARPLVDRLTTLVGADPVATEVAGVTPLGMIELSRRRVGLSLAEFLAAPEGGRYAAAQAYRALRRAVRVAHHAKAARVVITAGADVVTLLRGRLQSALAEAVDQSKAEIVLREGLGEAVDVTAG